MTSGFDPNTLDLDIFDEGAPEAAPSHAGDMLDLGLDVRLYEEACEVLKPYPWQQDVINAVLSGRDVLVRAPTSAGKSLCFWRPGMDSFLEGKGTCVVISPLIALMDDQALSLKEKGIPAVALHSSQSVVSRRARMASFSAGDAALAYISPESFETLMTKGVVLPKVSMVAIDEAHLVSGWGKDFRGSYLRIGKMLRQAGVKAPLMVLSATIPDSELATIETAVGLDNPIRIDVEPIRKNLRLEVHHLGETTMSDLCEHVAGTALRSIKKGGAVLIYTQTVNRAEKINQIFAGLGIHATVYTGQTLPTTKAKLVEDFRAGKLNIVIATAAFGMGIDRPDIRCTIQVEAPKNPADYWQMAGRAGRDGKPALCVMLDFEIEHAYGQTTSTSSAEFFHDAQNPPPRVLKKVYSAIFRNATLRKPTDTVRKLNWSGAEIATHAGVEEFYAHSSLTILENMLDGAIYRIPIEDKVFPIYPGTPGKGDRVKKESTKKVLAFLRASLAGGRMEATWRRIAKGAQVTLDEAKQAVASLKTSGAIGAKMPGRARTICVRATAPEPDDLTIDEKYLQEKAQAGADNLSVMVDYLKSADSCRQRWILNHASQKCGSDCGVCDVCSKSRPEGFPG